MRRLARLPLAHQPGTAWDYGLSTDVLGRLIEVVSGKSLDAFFAERIFTPLKMNDTHFVLPESKRGRLAALYKPGAGGTISRTGDGPTVKGALIYAASLPYRGTDGYFSGGAGLVSTAGDYARFLQMLLNRGELEGTRILRPETVQAMTRDQTGGLPLWIPVHGFTIRLWLRHHDSGQRGHQEGPGRHLWLGWNLLHRLLGRSPARADRHHDDSDLPLGPSQAARRIPPAGQRVGPALSDFSSADRCAGAMGQMDHSTDAVEGDESGESSSSRTTWTKARCSDRSATSSEDDGNGRITRDLKTRA